MVRGGKMDINKINIVGKGDYYEPNNINSIKKSTSEEIKVENNNDNKGQQVKISDVNSAVDKANKVLFKNNTHLQFRIHEKTNEVMVKIVDDVSGEVLKEIPPEKMLDLVAKLWEIAGIIVDKKA